MAIGGLHNLTTFGPSCYGESQVDGPSNRASSLLKMWRELEGDCVLTNSHRSRSQASSSYSDSLSSPTSVGRTSDDNTGTYEIENHDNNSITSEQSTELGDDQRERVRHVFQEWMNCEATSQPCDPIYLNHCSDSQIGIGGQRRPFRRICSRQTLLDLLVRARCEREKEIEGLLGQRPVSEFTNRNRIQALLRGRFLKNERSLPNKSTSSVAANELGLLRERHTVSGLREGFLSKWDNSASASVSFANKNNGELESTDGERKEIISETSISETAADETMSQQEPASEVIEIGSEHESNAQNEISLDTGRSQPEVSREETKQDEIVNSITIANEMLSENQDINYENESRENNSEQLDWPDDAISTSSRQDHSANNQWFQHAFSIDEDGEGWMQESREADDLQVAIDNWMDMPAGEVVGASFGRAPAFSFSDDDDDNARSMEIRELFSRRHVSSLLGSGFRASLDWVLQSHAERLGNNASGDWELEEVSLSHSLVDQGRGHHNDEDDRALSQSEAEDGYLFVPGASSLVTESQPLWDYEFQSEDMLHNNSSRQMGTEWEVITDLRTDMVRLQQRLNNMQSMLEQCMDMQIEFQRSVRQEVSAALNRTILTRDESKWNTLYDGSECDNVRKGICCVCRDSEIDSLLYRCGHMCTCSKCAEILVQAPGKCPMCRAPVVKSIQAYFIQ